jgi:ABC-type dipeptide/oligopeptide/nickel transport system permease subunit
MLVLCPQGLFVAPGLLLAGVGLAASAVLFSGHMQVGGIPLGLSAALCAAAWRRVIAQLFALSVIGLGVRPPTPEWGIMVAEGASFIISGEWWLALFPGAALMLAVFTFNLLGDGLRDLVDPQRRT